MIVFLMLSLIVDKYVFSSAFWLEFSSTGKRKKDGKVSKGWENSMDVVRKIDFIFKTI